MKDFFDWYFKQMEKSWPLSFLFIFVAMASVMVIGGGGALVIIVTLMEVPLLIPIMFFLSIVYIVYLYRKSKL